MVVVSETFFVNPSLTLLCAAFCNFCIWSIVPVTSFLKETDLFRASAATDITSVTSGVLGPNGSVSMGAYLTVDLLPTEMLSLEVVAGMADETE